MSYQRGPTGKIDSAFPFPNYREHQREILSEAAHSLFRDSGTDVVVIDAPTGIGKSPINVALARMANSAFYTTPQKKLRRQLEEDTDLRSYYQVVRARSDYRCSQGSDEMGRERTATCKNCPINQDPDESCRNYDCSYWNDKEAAMEAETATITFSYLIVDNNLDTFVDTDDGKTQVSFTDRELLIIDEAHSLEEQVASLHAGFTISSRTLPGHVYEIVESNIDSMCNRIREETPRSYTTVSKVRSDLKEIRRAISEQLREMQANPSLSTSYGSDLEDLRSLHFRMDHLFGDDRKSPWVIKPIEDETKLKLQPVRVDGFLDKFVWSRADKVILSTATMPFRSNPDKWLRRLGLNPQSANIITKPMPFPAENRPIHTRSMIDRFTNQGDQDNWGRIKTTLQFIADTHAGEKGLVHTVSYDRAAQLHSHFRDNSICHLNDNKPDEAYITQWQESDNDILFTPAMMEGVDLPGDDCRWQVLLKVPYPSLGDARIHHLVKEKGEDQWYNSITARKIIQSVGRGVRNKNDSCDYYVLDESWVDVMNAVEIPDWFEAAITD